MTNIEKLTAWMREQVGTQESGENNVIYNTHFYGKEVQGPQYPWCMAFIWDGFRACGLSSLFLDGGASAYCPYVMEWAKKHGKWVRGDYAPGDVLIYDWDGDGVADHTGFCLSDSGETVRAIEGNVTDRVAEVLRWKSVILGAYRPDYKDKGKAEEGTATPLLQRGAVGGAVLSVQVLLISKWRISCGVDGADGDYGPNTESAVKAFQRYKGIESDGVVGAETWRKLLN